MQIFHIDKQKQSNLEPAYIVNVVQALMERLNECCEIEAKFNYSLINPGKMRGTLAAQLFGEPAMQVMLPTSMTK